MSGSVIELEECMDTQKSLCSQFPIGMDSDILLAATMFACTINAIQNVSRKYVHFLVMRTLPPTNLRAGLPCITAVLANLV